VTSGQSAADPSDKPIAINVDDDDSARYIRSKILDRAGFRVIEAASGHDALAAVREVKPALVLLDVGLSDLSGFEICRRIKENPETAGTVVLEISAEFRDPELQVQGLNSGADGYIAEPVHPDVLAATAHALLRARKAEEHLLRTQRAAASERKEPLARVAAERELLQAILAQLPSGVMVAEAPSGRIVLCNAEADRLLGRPASGLKQIEDYQSFPAIRDDGSLYAPEEYPLARALIRGEVIRNEELSVRRSDGEIIRLAVNAAPLRPERGGMTGAVVAFHDITALKRVRRAMPESEAQFRQFADSIPHAVWVGRPDGTTEFVNRRYLECTGLDPEAAYAKDSWRPLIHPDDLPRFEQARQEFLRSGEGPPVEFRLRRARESEYRWQLGRGVGIRDGNGNIFRWFGTMTDIHDQKTAEQAVREAQKFESIGLLAGGIAHDFNNLLTSILGYASLLAENSGGPPRREVTAIVQAAEKAADLTRQLLAYSGKGRLVVAPIDISRVARDMSGLLRTSVPKGIALRQSLAGNLPPVEADPGQIQQIVMNLVMNAAESIPDGRAGEVTIRTGVKDVSEGEVIDHVSRSPLRPGRYAFIEVVDNGVGIDEEVASKMFDPFVTTKFIGRGLGLPAVAGIVKAHNGGIQVSSVKGEGSRFTVYLPTAHGEATAHPAAGAVVLVVDDEAVVREVAQAALEHSGYTVITASDGVEALRIMDHMGSGIGLVLLDLTMPVMGGEETERRLRETHPEVKVILMTGYSEVEARRRFSGARLAGFIQKPFTARRLIEKVEAVLGGSSEWEAA
jgi:PAS domain S-box-containing protein